MFTGASRPGKWHVAENLVVGNPTITAPIPGLISVHPVDNVVQAVKERRELRSDDKAELREATDEMWARLPTGYQWLKKWEYV